MSRSVVGPLEVHDEQNSNNKKLQAHIETTFRVDCACDNISVRVYWHAESEDASIFSPQGAPAHGDRNDPQGEPWTWIPGPDGWITDSKDADPDWSSFTCETGTNGTIVTVADRPGISIPPSAQGDGYTYAFEATWKIDILCDGQVIDHEYYRLTMTGSGSANGPVPGQLFGETERAALEEINDKMRATRSYAVDAEGKPW